MSHVSKLFRSDEWVRGDGCASRALHADRKSEHVDLAMRAKSVSDCSWYLCIFRKTESMKPLKPGEEQHLLAMKLDEFTFIEEGMADDIAFS
jgi:hypothetical protein